MRCLWCGVKYSEEHEDVAAGFCSSKCERMWEEKIRGL